MSLGCSAYRGLDATRNCVAGGQRERNDREKPWLLVWRLTLLEAGTQVPSSKGLTEALSPFKGGICELSSEDSLYTHMCVFSDVNVWKFDVTRACFLYIQVVRV